MSNRTQTLFYSYFPLRHLPFLLFVVNCNLTTNWHLIRYSNSRRPFFSRAYFCNFVLSPCRLTTVKKTKKPLIKQNKSSSNEIYYGRWKRSGLTIREVNYWPRTSCSESTTGTTDILKGVRPRGHLDLPSTVTRGSRFFKSSNDTHLRLSAWLNRHTVSARHVFHLEIAQVTAMQTCVIILQAGGDREGLISFSSGALGTAEALKTTASTPRVPARPAGWSREQIHHAKWPSSIQFTSAHSNKHGAVAQRKIWTSGHAAFPPPRPVCAEGRCGPVTEGGRQKYERSRAIIKNTRSWRGEAGGKDSCAALCVVPGPPSLLWGESASESFLGPGRGGIKYGERERSAQ